MLRLTPFEYLAPSTVDDAVALLVEHGSSSMLLGGGTDVFPNIKHRLANPRRLIGITRIGELADIKERADCSVHIGAAARLANVESHPAISTHYPALADAVRLISTPQVRRMGTIGGNICLDTRCNYYNQSEHWRRAVGYCMKKDSEICRVAPGSDRCWAISSSDAVPALLAYDARITIASPGQRREILLADFYRDDGLNPTELGPSDLVTAVTLPETSMQVVYDKLRIRMSFDFPLVGVATGLRLGPDRSVLDAKIIVTATGSHPTFVNEAQALLVGNMLTEELIAAAGSIVYRTIHPLDNTEGTIPHRKRMAQIYVERALRKLGGLERVNGI